jgi:hypothetical protein
MVAHSLEGWLRFAHPSVPDDTAFDHLNRAAALTNSLGVGYSQYAASATDARTAIHTYKTAPQAVISSTSR